MFPSSSPTPIPIIIQLLNSYLIIFFSIFLLWVSSWPKYGLFQNERSHFESGNSFMREWKPSSAFASLLSEFLLKPSNFWVVGISLMVLRRRGAKWGSSLHLLLLLLVLVHTFIQVFHYILRAGPIPQECTRQGRRAAILTFWGKKLKQCLRFLPG